MSTGLVSNELRPGGMDWIRYSLEELLGRADAGGVVGREVHDGGAVKRVPRVVAAGPG